MLVRHIIPGVYFNVDDNSSIQRGTLSLLANEQPKIANEAVVEYPALLIVFCPGQEDFVGLVGSVLAQQTTIIRNRSAILAEKSQTIVGIGVRDFVDQWTTCDTSRIVVVANDINQDMRPWNEALTSLMTYEILYQSSTITRCTLSRFLSSVTRQTSLHDDMIQKDRTIVLSANFENVGAILPNLDILSIGVDAIELRVDLLKESSNSSVTSNVPTIRFVGEQLMLLRHYTDLPIIYTVRSIRGDGEFPVDDPQLIYDYLIQGLRWGCEFIDVESWLPENIRRRIAESRGTSTIISTFHDFSGNFKWYAPEAFEIFRGGAVYASVVMMNVLATSPQDNNDLENFKMKVRQESPMLMLSALNSGRIGRISRALNDVLTPVTHPLLPKTVVSDQVSVADINHSLHIVGKLPRLCFYWVGDSHSQSRAMFFQQCINELGFPHRFVRLSQGLNIDRIVQADGFGGAYFDSPASSEICRLAQPSAAACAIGTIDAILVEGSSPQDTICGENMLWEGIKAILSRELVPSAYHGRSALVLADSEEDATPALYALNAMRVHPIYIVGFEASGTLAIELTPLTSIEDLVASGPPLALINALPYDRTSLIEALLKHYGPGLETRDQPDGKVFLDLADSPPDGDLASTAVSLGWTAHGLRDVRAWMIMTTLKKFTGHNVTYDFVRLASSRSSY